MESRFLQGNNNRRSANFEQQKSKVNYFDFLPPELIVHIFNFLKGHDLLNVRITCKLFFDIITEHIKVHVANDNIYEIKNTTFKNGKIVINITRSSRNLLDKLIYLRNAEYIKMSDWYWINPDFYKKYHSNKNIIKFPYLKNLCINWSSNITSKTLVRMTQLEYLSIFQSQIDQTCLGELTNLSSLIIRSSSKVKQNERINDTALSKLTQLTHLEIHRNIIVTDKSVSLLVNLKSLYLNYCHGITIDSLSKLKNLRTLTLKNMEILDNDFQHLGHLKYLSIKLPNITGEGLKYLINLEILNVYDYYIENRYFAPLTHLKKLYLECTGNNYSLLKKILPNVKVTPIME